MLRRLSIPFAGVSAITMESRTGPPSVFQAPGGASTIEDGMQKLSVHELPPEVLDGIKNHEFDAVQRGFIEHVKQHGLTKEDYRTILANTGNGIGGERQKEARLKIKRTTNIFKYMAHPPEHLSFDFVKDLVLAAEIVKSLDLSAAIEREQQSTQDQLTQMSPHRPRNLIKKKEHLAKLEPFIKWYTADLSKTQPVLAAIKSKKSVKFMDAVKDVSLDSVREILIDMFEYYADDDDDFSVFKTFKKMIILKGKVDTFNNVSELIKLLDDFNTDPMALAAVQRRLDSVVASGADLPEWYMGAKVLVQFERNAQRLAASQEVLRDFQMEMTQEERTTTEQEVAEYKLKFESTKALMLQSEELKLYAQKRIKELGLEKFE